MQTESGHNQLKSIQLGPIFVHLARVPTHQKHFKYILIFPSHHHIYKRTIFYIATPCSLVDVQ
jgi:hypothetical protein